MKQPLLLAYFLLCGILFCSVKCKAQNACSSVPGLVAQFPLDEMQGITAKDATGQVANGSLVNGSSSMWQPSGGWDGGGALALTGSAYLDIPLNWTPQSFSFSFWLKPTRRYDWGQLTGAKARWGAFLFHSSSTGALFVGTDAANRIEYTTPETVQLNVWQHFVFTFTKDAGAATGVGAIYKNGKLLLSKAGMNASQPWQGVGLGYLSGDALYDEVRVYNRAISPQEVGTLMGRYEAELPAPQVVLTNGATIGSSNGVTYAQNLTTVGSKVSFVVSVPTTGMYKVSTRYAAAAEYVRTMSLYVNNTDVAQAQFPTTSSGASWTTQSTTVFLTSGCNTIAYAYDADDNGGINLDYITLKSDSSPGFKTGSAAASALPSEIGVDKFTGIATFNVPLYTVTIPGVALPVALHYSASGVQVDDLGGEVGLNWSLQAAPSIHRQVRDLPDDILVETTATPEKRYGWLRYPVGSPTPADRIRAVPDAPTAFTSTTCTATEQLALTQLTSLGSLNHIQNNEYKLFDTEPDVFTYSIPGYSGKFVFDETGSVRLLPYAPIQITPVFSAGTGSYLPSTCPASIPAGELAGFTIKTAEGVLYTFNDLERISQQAQSTAPYGGTKYLLRHYYGFKINQYVSGSTPPSGPTNIDYNTGWLATQITTPVAQTNPAVIAANSITFGYACSPHIPVPDSHGNLFLLGNSTANPSPDNSLVTRVLLSPQLTTISTAKATVTFNRKLDESDNYHVSSLTITSPFEQNALVKSYTFNYLGVGRYLSKILLNRTTSTLPLYSFNYASDDGGSPPASAKIQTGVNINKDYWGFANGNKTFTGIPQLYVYPQLLGSGALRPAAPYRLYPVTAYQSGGIVLSGADRRPASRLSIAVAGTLTRVTFATGGQVGLEYEQNQFYDPVAQQSLPAGGLRIRTIRVQDPITQVESRRDYTYQDGTATTAAVSSGVLLHLPRFAFAMPLTTSSQWADVTVRSVEELAPDPFEDRHIGYRQVTEIVPSQGQVTTVFSVPGGADDISSDYNAASNLPQWQRPVFGIARQSNSGSCPAVAPLQATGELYPFAPAPNYNFARGLPLTVQYRAEPSSGTAPGSVVKQEAYSYQYTSVRPGSVTGLRYEQLGDPSFPLYAYAKYSLLTDFFYAVRQQSIQLPVVGGTTNQTTTTYRYNTQGGLASRVTQGSDNILSRTRYKYLSDYALPASGTSGALQAMSTRVKGEGVTADLVETISEIRPAGSAGPVAYVGATLQTFTTSSLPDANNTLVSTATYPYQLRRWQAVQPVASYDSVRIVNNALYIPTALREVATVLEVNASLTPLSTRTQAGRQLSGVLVGYEGSVPVLQTVNARASEVVFSDFETVATPSSFKIQAASNPTYIAASAARTGKAGLILGAGSSLTTSLPVSTTLQYRLVFWAQGAATTCTVALSTGTTPVFTQPVAHDGAGKWQRYEVLLPNRANSQLSLTANGSLQLDDVLLLPVEASAVSTTYSFDLGKTSETDVRGRTTYYEYGPTGDLALVRDHNQAIVHQYQKVLPSRTVTTGISFTTSGTGLENEPLIFTATSGLKGALQYRWDFGDGATTSYATEASTTHIYPTLGSNKSYNVRLYVTSQGTEYLYTTNVGIARQPLRLTNCTAGVVAVDDCYKTGNVQVDVSCNPNAPNSSTYATFRVTPNLTGSFTYTWQVLSGDSFSPWQSIAGNTNDPSSLSVGKSATTRYRCRVDIVTNVPEAYQSTYSEEFQINHYKSDISCP
jgi:hypothetical protein